ncbi:hypothetical protein EVAR_31621_1 [Eumeta japonica]|uniref:DhaK domain-containing protein n=1 Tax=Eumeta variegata TaxID=151549 RepID=A0A4C1W230_EUMVA|nr:hypothetical protein EVAR_31621_1 [Eumeta japonica]
MKLINSVETCVDENLRGLVYTHPGLRLHPGYRVVTLNQKSPNKVAILTGGGSGHEPFTAGFIGDGALSGAVAGGIFASPPTSNILYGISHLCGHYHGGVLVIIPNYTGDRLNFGKAIEKAKIAGLKVEGLILGEDVASSANKTGGRGMCGLVVLYKMCGAMAADGMDLDYIFDMAKTISKRMATLSVCLKACSLPGQPPLFEIAHGELDLGAGVHGEAGIERRKLGTAKETIELVLGKILSHLSLAAKDRVAVMINNLGSTSVLEVNILAMEIKEFLNSKNIRLERIYSGHLMTSLEMHGVQICVLHLNSEHGDNWLQLLDAKTNAPGWPGGELSLVKLEKMLRTKRIY